MRLFEMDLLTVSRSPSFKEKDKVLFFRRTVVMVLKAAVFAANLIEQTAIENVFHKGVAHSGFNDVADMQYKILHGRLLSLRRIPKILSRG